MAHFSAGTFRAQAARNRKTAAARPGYVVVTGAWGHVVRCSSGYDSNRRKRTPMRPVGWVLILGALLAPARAESVQVVAQGHLAPSARWEQLARQGQRLGLLPAAEKQASLPSHPLPDWLVDVFQALAPHKPPQWLVLTDGVVLEPLVLLPCGDPQAVLRGLGDASGGIAEVQPGLWKLGHGSWTGFARRHREHLVLAQHRKAFRLLEHLELPPADETLRSLASVTVYPSRVPLPYREMILDHLRGFPRPKASTAAKRPSGQVEWSLVVAELLLQQTEAVTVLVDLPGDPPRLVFQMQVVPRAGTPLARLVRRQSALRPRLSPPSQAVVWCYAAWEPVREETEQPPRWLKRLEQMVPAATIPGPLEGLVWLQKHKEHFLGQFVLLGVQPERLVRQLPKPSSENLPADSADRFHWQWNVARQERLGRWFGTPLQLRLEPTQETVRGWFGQAGVRPGPGKNRQEPSLPEGTILAGRIGLGAVLAHEAQARRTSATGYVLALAARGLQQGGDHLALTLSAKQSDVRLQLELGPRALQVAVLAGRLWWQSRRIP